MKVTLIKSLIGSKKDQIATAHALGLFKVGDCREQPEIGRASCRERVWLRV